MQNIRRTCENTKNTVKQRCKRKQENSDHEQLCGILSKFSSENEGINSRTPNTKEKENLSSWSVLKIKLSIF